MMKHMLLFVALSAAGCDQGVKPHAKTTVALMSVAFAEDCGGTAPAEAPVQAAPMRTASVPTQPSVAAQEPADSAVPRRCDQTSMQLSIVGAAGSELHIKSVEVFEENGTLLGTLTASKPTQWNRKTATYETWDEKIVTTPTAVSYVLSQPVFVDQWNARNRTYTVKVTAAVGGTDQPLKTTVMVVGRPAPVPT